MLIRSYQLAYAYFLGAWLCAFPAAAETQYSELLPVDQRLDIYCRAHDENVKSLNDAREKLLLAQSALEQCIAAGCTAQVLEPLWVNLSDRQADTFLADARASLLSERYTEITAKVPDSSSAILAFTLGRRLSWSWERATGPFVKISSSFPTMMVRSIDGGYMASLAPSETPVIDLQVKNWISGTPRLAILPDRWYDSVYMSWGIEYTVGGTVGQICDRMNSDGQLLSFEIVLPFLDGRDLSAEFVVSRSGSHDTSSVITHDLLIGRLFEDLFSLTPPAKTTTGVYITYCGSTGIWNRSSDDLQAHVDEFHRAISALRMLFRKDARFGAGRTILDLSESEFAHLGVPGDVYVGQTARPVVGTSVHYLERADGAVPTMRLSFLFSDGTTAGMRIVHYRHETGLGTLNDSDDSVVNVLGIISVEVDDKSVFNCSD